MTANIATRDAHSCLQGLDRAGVVIYAGTFNAVLFPPSAWPIWWCRPAWWIALPRRKRSACGTLLCSIRRCSATSSPKGTSPGTFDGCANCIPKGWPYFWSHRAPVLKGCWECLTSKLDCGRWAGWHGNPRRACGGRGGKTGGRSNTAQPLLVAGRSGGKGCCSALPRWTRESCVAELSSWGGARGMLRERR